MTADSDKGRQAGNGWDGVIVVGGSHSEGVFQCVQRVIYRSTHVGLVLILAGSVCFIWDFFLVLVTTNMLE